MPKKQSGCMRIIMMDQKCIIVISATVVGLLGLLMVISAHSALNNEEFEKDAQMANEFAKGGADLEKQVQGFMVLGILTTLASLLGCVGACRENKCSLCIYAMFALAIGLGFLMVGITAVAMKETETPNLVRASNRICGNMAMMEEELKCPVAPDTTPAANVAPSPAAATAATTRRLAVKFLALGLAPQMEEFALFGPGSKGRAALFAATQMAGGVMEHEDIMVRGRLLSAGTSEKQLILKMSEGGNAEAKCSFIRELCIPPEGFDATTACMCLGSTSATVSSADTGSFCKDWGSALPTCTGEGGGPECNNWCYVAATSTCSADMTSTAQLTLEEANEINTVAGVAVQVSTPGLKSTAPCEGMPDTRSKMVKEGLGIMDGVLKAVLGVGCMLLLSVLFSMCLCCEIHTGKKVHDHVRGEMDSSDDE